MTLPVEGAVITVDGEATDVTTDAEGKAAFTISEPGTHIVSAVVEGKRLVTPVLIAKVNAPFIRLGCDWNFLRNKFQDNRMFVGARWGFSTFKYDMSGPAQTDSVYGGTESFDFSGTSCTSHWLEIVFGCQVKIVANFHMGWSIRLKYHLSSSKNDSSKPYYIPGYGTTVSGNTWSGSYNLIFDLNWGKPKKKKQ